jgi:DNA-binding response OmpR family regulator
MPEMDGFDVLRELRRNEALTKVPVFVITAKDLTSAEVALLNQQASAVFRKDGQWKEDLLRQVQKVLRGHAGASAVSKS